MPVKRARIFQEFFASAKRKPSIAVSEESKGLLYNCRAVSVNLARKMRSQAQQAIDVLFAEVSYLEEKLEPWRTKPSRRR